jgi:hypothetical protein
MATVPNYLIGGGVTPSENPFQTGLTEGMRFGATMQDFQAAQLQRQQAQQDRELKLQQQQQAMQVQQQQQQAQQAEQQRIADIRTKYAAYKPKDFNTLDVINLASTFDKDTQTSMKELFAKLPEEGQLQQVKTLGGITSAVRSGNIDAAKSLITEQIEANKETDPQESARYKNMLETLNTNPSAVFTTIAPILATFGKPGQDALSSILGAEKTGVETRKLTAEAQEQETKSKFAEKVINADLAKKYAEIGLTKAQASQAVAQSNNLNDQGKILKLDFQAALQGLPLPSKAGTTTVAAATEDERKAQGWLNQATNAYQNMLNSMYTKTGKPTGAEKAEFIESLPLVGGMVGGFTRSTDREKFRQASSSLSEALLRAATGAGVNKDEAEQKLQELTPLYTDDAATRKQKLEAIPMYLQSLQSRAGRAATPNYKVPTAPAAGQRNVTVDY